MHAQIRINVFKAGSRWKFRYNLEGTNEDARLVEFYEPGSITWLCELQFSLHFIPLSLLDCASYSATRNGNLFSIGPEEVQTSRAPGMYKYLVAVLTPDGIITDDPDAAWLPRK
jgi:hypothetical protein